VRSPQLPTIRSSSLASSFAHLVVILSVLFPPSYIFSPEFASTLVIFNTAPALVLDMLVKAAGYCSPFRTHIQK